MRTNPIKLTAWILLGLIFIVLLLAVAATHVDWNRSRDWIAHRASEAVGRPVEIRGDLRLTWHRPGEFETGLARWVPLPLLQAQDVVIGNPVDQNTPSPWSSPYMAQVGSLQFLLRPLPLIQRRLVFAIIALDDPRIALQRLKDGRNNWSFRKKEPAEPDAKRWELEIEDITVLRGRLLYDDEQEDIDLQFRLDTLQDAAAAPYRVGLEVGGTFHGAKVSGRARGGAVLSLQDTDTPYPVEGQVKVGDTSIGVTGTLSDPLHLSAVDMRLRLAGNSMAHLYPLLGITLPETSRFFTEGRLRGTVDRKRGEVIYENFTGRVGGSDLSGTLRFVGREPRPLLAGEVRSRVLRFVDLAPLIGADSAASKAARDAPAPARRAAGKVLPNEAFKVERWDTIDADVKFRGERILRDEELPINDLSTHLVLKDAVLRLKPLNFGVAGGTLSSDITLDSTAKPMRAELKLQLSKIRLKELFPTVESMQGSFGLMGGDAVLDSRGNSVAELLAQADGEARVLVNQGSFSKFLLEAAGLNVGSVVLTRLFGDRQVQLNCMAGNFAVEDGVMKTRAFLFDTEEAFITMTGNVDMRRERLDLVLRPEQKTLRILSLRTPLYVRGSFSDPDVSVDTGVVALKAGGAVVLGLLAPITALLPLVNTSEEQQIGCGDVLKGIPQPAAATAR